MGTRRAAAPAPPLSPEERELAERGWQLLLQSRGVPVGMAASEYEEFCPVMDMPRDRFVECIKLWQASDRTSAFLSASETKYASKKDYEDLARFERAGTSTTVSRFQPLDGKSLEKMNDHFDTIVEDINKPDANKLRSLLKSSAPNTERPIAQSKFGGSFLFGVDLR